MSASGWTVELAGRIGPLAIDVAFEAGSEPVAIVGPNGAGKTTLLRTIAGARAGLRGRVVLAGRTLEDHARGLALAPEARRIGYVPQGYALFPHLDALGNVAFGIRGRHAREQARTVLRELAIEPVATRRPTRLSGGERQRVALARALASDPAGLLLDEPLAALDAQSRRATRAVLAERLRLAGKPAIVVTHDPRDLVHLGGTVIVIETGRIVAQGALDELVRAPSTAFMAEFFELLGYAGAR